jgi:hypothetical protein
MTSGSTKAKDTTPEFKNSDFSGAEPRVQAELTTALNLLRRRVAAAKNLLQKTDAPAAVNNEDETPPADRS